MLRAAHPGVQPFLIVLLSGVLSGIPFPSFLLFRHPHYKGCQPVGCLGLRGYPALCVGGSVVMARKQRVQQPQAAAPFRSVAKRAAIVLLRCGVYPSKGYPTGGQVSIMLHFCLHCGWTGDGALVRGNGEVGAHATFSGYAFSWAFADLTATAATIQVAHVEM